MAATKPLPPDPNAPKPKRYVTKIGFEKMRERFRFLLYEERPRMTREVQIAAAHGDRSENYEYKLGKRRLREIDGEIFRLQKKLESLEVIDPASRPKSKQAFFGATITFEDADGNVSTVQIVGSDELEDASDRQRISYDAPMGRALLGKKEGDEITVKRPAGDLELTVLNVEWR